MRVRAGYIEQPIRGKRRLRVVVGLRRDSSPNLDIRGRVTKRQRRLCERTGHTAPGDTEYVPPNAITACVFVRDDGDGDVFQVTTVHCPRCLEQLWQQTKPIASWDATDPLPPEPT